MMNDPYGVLGISQNASDEDVKTAYKSLVMQYMNSERKLAELNAAYDAIMNLRRGSTGGDNFHEVRVLINQGNYAKAEELLINQDSSRAEWNFLMGTICYAKGWLNDSYRYFKTAAETEPGNAEYNSALKRMDMNKNGYMNGGNPGYNTSDRNSPACGGGCSTCDFCQGLICMDCCCECMGGDCISCC